MGIFVRHYGHFLLLLPELLHGEAMTPRKRQSPRRPLKKNFASFGWIPDLPDSRDIMYRDVRPVLVPVPEIVDLRPLCSAVEDQGSLGSCTAQALVGALEFLEKKDNVPFADLSRLFVYYNERVIEHTVRSDSGAMLRDGIKTLARQGVCTEKKWPYIVASFIRKPSPACYREALDHQIVSYQRILTLEEMLSCLAEGFPFVFGFTVYESFVSSRVSTSGIVDMPNPRERVLGGHAVLAVGYRQTERRFIVRNSWGAGWGQKGYCTMPFDYLSDRNLSDDFWVIRTGELM